MKRFSVFCLVVFAALVVGAGMAVSASASPSILMLVGETGGSLLIKSVANTNKTILETELSNKVNGEGVLLQLHFPNVNEPKGTYELLFTKVKYGTTVGQTCNSIGDTAEEVLLPKSTFRLVFDSLTVLGAALLILVPQFKFICKTGATTTLLASTEGNQLVLVSPINKEVLTSENIGGVSRCTAGTPKDKTWWNEAGGKEAAGLKANVGLGNEEACENVEGTVQSTVSKMAELMG
jgi:hypothetical protein